MTIVRRGPWVRWFAWRPVDVYPFGWRWLVHVRRRRFHADTFPGYDGWEYAPINQPTPLPEETR